jgi:hypothetical protein
MSRRKTVILAVGAAAFWGCADNITAPRPVPPKNAAKDCSTQLYYDPTTCSDFGSGGYTYTDLNGAGDALAVITIAGTPPAGVSANVPAVCPAFYKALVPATLFPVGQDPMTIISSGYFIPTSGNTVSGRGTYAWPAGWWPSTDGSGREANISSASAVCFFGPAGPGLWTIYVNFYNFIGTIRQGTSSSSGGGGSGGGGGGGGSASCQTEFITIEVDYGAGWQTFWSGYAQVCS